MEFDELPGDYDEAKPGPQRHRMDFASVDEKLAYDARNLIRIAEEQSKRLGITVDPITLARRSDDDIGALRAAIAKEQKAVSTEAADSGEVPAETGAELSPEQVWFEKFKTRFDVFSQLHQGIEWADVERSLKADPGAMRRLQVLDEKGHAMNVFGEENDGFIFASGWTNVNEISEDHRNIVFDKAAQDYLKKNYPKESCNGNAADIAEALGVDLADPKFHKQLIKAIAVNGWAWLKTDDATRRGGCAFLGFTSGFGRVGAASHYAAGSFRAALRVKKA